MNVFQATAGCETLVSSSDVTMDPVATDDPSSAPSATTMSPPAQSLPSPMSECQVLSAPETSVPVGELVSSSDVTMGPVATEPSSVPSATTMSAPARRASPAPADRQTSPLGQTSPPPSAPTCQAADPPQVTGSREVSRFILVSGTRVGTSIHTVARTLRGSFESGGCGISISGYAVGEPGDGTSFILECPSSRASTVVQVAWDQVEREGQFLSVSFVAPSDLGAIAMTRYDHQPVASSSSGRSSFGSSNRYRPYPPSRRMGQDTPLPGTLLPFLPSPAQFSSQRQHNYFGANLRMARKQARNALATSPGPKPCTGEDS